MKRYLFFTCLILLIFLFSGYKTYKNYGVYISDVATVKQDQDDWCVYACAEMARGQYQCDFASEYIRWKNEQDGIIDPTEFDCCQYGPLCGPVSFQRLIAFWNHITYSSYYRWSNVIWLFNENNGDREDLPRLGVIDASQGSTLRYHAIWVFRIEITYDYVATNAKFTTYEVAYIDPWTGCLDVDISTTSAGEGSSNVLVLKQ